MLLSELLDAPVHGPDGRDLGRVVDVRFRRDDRTDAREGRLILIALIISPHSRMSFYGYERGRVNRPAVIAKAIAWIHRKSRVVPWECVQIVTDQGVFLGVEPPVIPLDVRRPLPAQQP